jgi:hypothetical protein
MLWEELARVREMSSQRLPDIVSRGFEERKHRQAPLERVLKLRWFGPLSLWERVRAGCVRTREFSLPPTSLPSPPTPFPKGEGTISKHLLKSMRLWALLGGVRCNRKGRGLDGALGALVAVMNVTDSSVRQGKACERV